MIFKKKTKVQIVVMSVVSLLLVTVGVALASTTNATLTFCASKSSGILRYATNGKCKSNETKLQLNKQGSTGARGPVGPAGPAGPAATSTPSTTFQYAVGDVGPAGGVIFFVDTANQFDWFNYIETAPLSKSSEEALNLYWDNWCFGFNGKSLGANASSLGGIGDGKTATNLMLSKCTGGAAHAADSFSNSAEVNWYLPSRGEAYLAFQVLTQFGWQSHTNDGYYTATEKSATETWKMNAVEMSPYIGNKYVENYVLPIRYFE
jgi:hypothetical protein